MVCFALSPDMVMASCVHGTPHFATPSELGWALRSFLDPTDRCIRTIKTPSLAWLAALPNYGTPSATSSPPPYYLPCAPTRLCSGRPRSMPACLPPHCARVTPRW